VNDYDPYHLLCVPEHPYEPLIRRHGACVGSGVDMLVTGDDREGIARAKAVCAQCPVRTACREVADYLEPRLFGKPASRGAHASGMVGVWGGESPAERRSRRRAAYAAEQVTIRS
jgi:hypothetical protein